MQAQAIDTSIWGSWWRMGGAAGIAFIVMFIAAIAIVGEPPSRDDSVEEIRRYFVDDGQRFLVADFLFAFAHVFFFLPFAIVLREVLRRPEGDPPIFSSLVGVGALLYVAIGASQAFVNGTLALGAAENSEIDDSFVRGLSEIQAYAANLGSVRRCALRRLCGARYPSDGRAVALAGRASLAGCNPAVGWRHLGDRWRRGGPAGGDRLRRLWSHYAVGVGSLN